MAQLDLTSHHVNYLIWRYLQESGHGEAAVSLQREWNPDPQSLPFARHIQTHALVSLVQKGLRYHELQSSIDKEGNRIPFTPSNYFFGPEHFDLKALQPRRDEAGTDHPVAPDTADRVTNGHPVEKLDKKNRQSEITHDESMEVDAEIESKGSPIATPDGDGDVSMGAEEVPPPEPTLMNGNSIGVQISPAKTADLAPDTALLHADDHVITAAWRPRDPTVLVTSGENFCSLWKLPLSSSPVQNLFLDLRGTNGYVTTVAWDAVGGKLAVASMRDLRGSITMYNTEGNVVDMLPDMPRLINGLHWAEDSPQMIVVASDERSSELALWDDNRRPDVYPPPQVIDSHVYDLAWCGRNQVFACGDGAVYQCEVDHNVRLTRTYSSSDADATWTFIRCVQTDVSPVAVAADSAKFAIWIPTHDILIENAHQDAITSIDIRPQSHAQCRTSVITIASYSTDGTVNVWRVDLESRQFKRVHRLRLGSFQPALAGSFSPDGFALGAVSKNELFIWNAERGGDPMATWTAPGSDKVKEEPSHTNGQNGHEEPFPDRALSWDSNGKKLACGFGKQMAIVNFQR